MGYSFDIKHAETFGVDEAIFLQNIIFWIRKNKANEINRYEIEIDGDTEYRTFTYNSIKAFSKLFPFWTARQINRITKSLEDNGVIIVGNFNKLKYDRTKWYALKDESLLELDETSNADTKKDPSKVSNVPTEGNNGDIQSTISPNGQVHFTKRSIGIDQTVKPIPDINTDINRTDINKEPRATRCGGDLTAAEVKLKLSEDIDKVMAIASASAGGGRAGSVGKSKGSAELSADDKDAAFRRLADRPPDGWTEFDKTFSATFENNN